MMTSHHFSGDFSELRSFLEDFLFYIMRSRINGRFSHQIFFEPAVDPVVAQKITEIKLCIIDFKDSDIQHLHQV
jgi:hypothetical protein